MRISDWSSDVCSSDLHHSFAQANNGVHAFAPAGIGHPDHRAVEDGGMRAERIFDFGREDILAARDDHVLEPVADEQKAIIVHMPEIARLAPDIDDCLRGEFGLVQIAEPDPVMPHGYFSGS